MYVESPKGGWGTTIGRLELVGSTRVCELRTIDIFSWTQLDQFFAMGDHCVQCKVTGNILDAGDTLPGG